jgi:hypothetical protein
MSIQKKSLVAASKTSESKTAKATSGSIKGKAPKGEKQTNLRRR